jgi:hypothetical protein
MFFRDNVAQAALGLPEVIPEDARLARRRPHIDECWGLARPFPPIQLKGGPILGGALCDRACGVPMSRKIPTSRNGSETWGILHSAENQNPALRLNLCLAALRFHSQNLAQSGRGGAKI